jgi:phenylacetate-CoA ligase
MNERNLRPEEIRCAEDLARLPVLTKDIVRKNTPQLMAKNISQMAVSWTKTGGTTGEPMQVCKDIECRAWGSMCFERGLEWGGKKVDDRAISLTSSDRRNRVGTILRRDLFIPAFELGADNVLSYFDKVRRSKSRFIIGYPSALYRLARFAEELNQEIDLAAVFPTGELMLPEWEEVIRKTFRCLVLPYYGCGEVNSLGFSVPGSNSYLIPEEHSLIEVMQMDGTTQLYGDGRFLITDLDNYAMPIIRYANGDAGQTASPNGHFQFSRIARLDGRYNSLLMTDKGDLISGMAGTYIFRQTSSLVQSYRVIQEEPLRLVIKVVPNDDLSKEDERLIVGLFTKYLGDKMKITIEKVSTLPIPPSGKSVFVINHCLQ